MTEEEYQESVLSEAKNEISRDRDNSPHGEEIRKMKNFLRVSGEKTNKNTGELYREHIPASVFGISSDEIASDLGMTENELMTKITKDLHIKEPKIRRILSRIKLTEKKKETLTYGELRQRIFDGLITRRTDYTGVVFYGHILE